VLRDAGDIKIAVRQVIADVLAGIADAVSMAGVAIH
jgi:hypothetical protein